MDLPLPNFLIVGAMRSGTSSLAHYLRQHPQVFLPRHKEIRFFDVYFAKGIEWYSQWFEESQGALAIGEASPNYMYLPEAVERIRTTLPEARLICTLRNPVDRAYSHYWWNRGTKRESLSFEEAIRTEAKRRNSEGIFDYSYVSKGQYAEQLKALFRHYPPDSILVLIFEEFVADPGGTLDLIFDFLGVDDGFRPKDLGRPFGRFIIHRSVRVRRLARRLPRHLGRVVGRLNQRRVPYPRMDPRLRTELLDVFKESNAEVERLLGREVPQWRA